MPSNALPIQLPMSVRQTKTFIPDPNSKIPKIRLTGFSTFRGCEALYFAMGKSRYGIKVYRTESLAKKSYKRQKIASRLGLAPKVGNFYCIETTEQEFGQRKPYYGFETQKARQVTLRSPVWQRDNQKLYDELRKIYLHGDFCEHNCGVINNKLVAIDFGSHCDVLRRRYRR